MNKVKLVGFLLLAFCGSSTFASPRGFKSNTHSNNQLYLVSRNLGQNNNQRLINGAGNPELVNFDINVLGELFLDKIPKLTSFRADKVIGKGYHGETLVFSANPELQALTNSLVKNTRAPHVAVVTMDPRSGRILSMAGKSTSLPSPTTHAMFPAASLFKIVTTASALENAHVSPFQRVNFRGGTYTLNRYNYLGNRKADRRSMTLAEALGKSCNPVFARVVQQYSSAQQLRNFSKRFGFNSDLKFDSPLLDSLANIPNDGFGLARTAAGFGDVKISPIHAATLMSSLANGGIIMRPSLVDSIISDQGKLLYSAPAHRYLERTLDNQTANKLLEMLHSTTTVGTSRREFAGKNWFRSQGIKVAAKTGTLSGSNPRGLNRWFIAAAPITNPKIVVSVIVVNPGNALASPAKIGRTLIEKALKDVL